MTLLKHNSLIKYLKKDPTTSLENPTEKKLLKKPSPNKGFRPVYIYSNQDIAEKEVPSRLSIKNDPHNAMPYAQVFQDKVILALSKANDKNNPPNEMVKKFFVDLAANDAVELSNTLFLEQNGWDGVCIEGNPEYWYGLARYRNCTIVGAFVGGSVDGTKAEIALRGSGGGIVGSDFDNKESKENESVKRELVSLMTVFKRT